MPELPDLQIFSRNLQKKLAGKTVKKVTVVLGKKLNVPVSTLKKAIEDQKLIKVYREGKELYFEFANGHVLALHLMLRGQLHLFEGKNEHKSTIIELLFNDGTGLALTDPQGQAHATLDPEDKESPDALSKKVGYGFLKDQLSSTKAAIKNVLLDQHVIRGIGNAYADEILWDAGISPFSVSSKIPDKAIRKLARSIGKVLKNAEKQIVKTHPHIISGEVRDFLDIHNARKHASPTGAPIRFNMANSRKTYYTDEQELYS